MITDEQIRTIVDKQIHEFLSNLADDDASLDDLIGEHLRVDTDEAVWESNVERLRVQIRSHRSVYEWSVRKPVSVAEAKEAD